MLRIVKFFCLTISFLVAGLACDAALGQWPVNGAPMTGAVPQYRPSRYPLAIQTTTHQPGQEDSEPGESETENPSVTATSDRALPDLPATPKMEQLPEPDAGADSKASKLPMPTPLIMAPPKAPAKKATGKKKTKKRPPAKPIVDYKIYRDRNRLPMDPRKPCNTCTQQRAGCKNPRFAPPGRGGQPYHEREPGGFTCNDKKCGKEKSDFSLYWPRPFSAKLDERFPKKASARYAPCQKKRIVDVFDSLSTFKISNYKRKDNGYCGYGSDPFGCLGESKQLAQMAQTGEVISLDVVRGVGYPLPSEPIARP